MKSCRNCSNAKHFGSFDIMLVCAAKNKRLASSTGSVEEGRRIDEKLRTTANTCETYQGEYKCN